MGIMIGLNTLIHVKHLVCQYRYYKVKNVAPSYSYFFSMFAYSALLVVLHLPVIDNGKKAFSICQKTHILIKVRNNI